MPDHRLLATPLAVAAACVAILGVSPGFSQVRPEPDALGHTPPALVDRLRDDAFAYFRFVNRPWTARVCDVFADEIRDLPPVRLHGDAHIEQFALTSDAWGLDDFDDAARGAALVDIVRFIGSVDLGSRLRGWTRDREMLFDRFFQGYRRGLSQPDVRPPLPAIVRYFRSQGTGPRDAFLAWGDAQMRPMTEVEMETVSASLAIFSRLVDRERPGFPPGYLQVVRAGWIHLGVGSALSRKILIHVQGPSAEPGDDVLIEAKESRYPAGLRCLEDPPSPAPLRVIAGARAFGRLKHGILMAGPEFVVSEGWTGPQPLKDWWIRSWDPSYREVHLADLRSANDLGDIAYDVGLQLGAGGLRDNPDIKAADRQRMLAAITRHEKRMRTGAASLVDELLLGWRELGGR